MNPTVRRGVIASTIPDGWSFIFYVFAFLVASALAVPTAYAAKGGNGNGGNGGSSGPFAVVSGTVTNQYGLPIAGATVTFDALTASFSTGTDATGQYTIKVSPATYDVSFEATYHTTKMVSGSVLKGKNNTLDAVLTAVGPVGVSASVSGNTSPGGNVTATGTYAILKPGCSVSGTDWSLEEGPATINSQTDATAEVTLGSATEFAAHLVHVLEEPPITAADLPPNLNLQPINEIEKGLQSDRNQVVAINPMGLEKGGEVLLKYTVSTNCGEFSAEANTATQLPWEVNPGLRNVPVNNAVLLYAAASGPYNWTITEYPGSTAPDLMDADKQTPWFTPTVKGTYRVHEANSGADLYVDAGYYKGVIDADATLDSVLTGDTRPVAVDACTGCHDDNTAPDNFKTWRWTGHAEAFTQGITTNGHFGEGCFACHSVGFGKNAGGIDDQYLYGDFVTFLKNTQDAALIDPSALDDNWIITLTDYADVARMSNIQCENCHGPQDGFAHPDKKDERISLAADVCGSCHGEPARHGRFQQWLLSNHADYDLAKERGVNDPVHHVDATNCGRCHSGNGFVQWSEHNFDPTYLLTVTWDESTVVPQTCATCHDPHDTGTTSGGPDTNAKVRVNADGTGACGDSKCNTNVLLAGFKATNVGRGATCMTCHNSRAGTPRNDGTWASLDEAQKTDSPHHGVQADLVMGQNMYFTGDLPLPGAHANIEDVCVTCHMEKTAPPDILSYNHGGTNHTFAADPGICSDCHGDAGAFLADQVDNEITGYMDNLKKELGAGWMSLLAANYPVTGACAADDTNPITAVEWVYGGYQGNTRLNITVKDGTTCSKVDPAKVNTNAGTAQALGLATNDGALYKAAWNYGLNYEDETINGCPAEGEPGYDPTCTPPHTHRGVHNHAFSQEALLGAIDAVEEVVAAP